MGTSIEVGCETNLLEQRRDNERALGGLGREMVAGWRTFADLLYSCTCEILRGRGTPGLCTGRSPTSCTCEILRGSGNTRPVHRRCYPFSGAGEWPRAA